MKVNDVVYQNYQGIRRFGVVRQVELHGDGWTYAGVKWIDDESYDRAMSALFVNWLPAGLYCRCWSRACGLRFVRRAPMLSPRALPG